MNLPFFFARRYLFSPKTHNVINIISAISLAGVAVGTMALIAVLSAFNGIENLVITLFNSFDPHLKITAAEGKTFDGSIFPGDSIRRMPGVAHYTEVLQESALVKYRGRQTLATIKGVSAPFLQSSGLDTMITEGKMLLEESGRPRAIAGKGIAISLGLMVNDPLNPLFIYVPRRGKGIPTNPADAFYVGSISAAGIFSIQQEFDREYIIVPLSFARTLMHYERALSAVEIGLGKGADAEKIQRRVRAIAGSGFEVKNRYEQHAWLYRIMKNEKWAVFLILTFILIIAAFNATASVAMLIYEKRRDIRILWSMGSEIGTLRKIFVAEGMLITLFGCICGLAAGAFLCRMQQQYEFLKFKGNFVTEAIPVVMEWRDCLSVLVTVIAIGVLASWFPSKQIIRYGWFTGRE